MDAGTKLGTYEILEPVGAGGMGEVYRARDSKLKRDVAIKLLPEFFSRDNERLLRFQREAEALASLNHPHIAAIYDLARFEQARFLVLEFVEGETLSERIARGPLPIDEAIEIAKQIADALEAAHEKGITHRDLKPANIKLTIDGRVKVLDFGLAKVRPLSESAGPDLSAALSNSPTLMTATTPGIVMGTAAYMSPEQAKGKDADRTADIWAFGCVLYEMLTGTQAFDGETVGEILGGIFKSEPDWSRLPPGLPEGLQSLLRRCLRKDRRHRLQHIGDARIEIEDAENMTPVETKSHASSRRRERAVWISLLTILTLAATAAVTTRRPAPALSEMRLEIGTPSTISPSSLAISPDGQKIVYVADSEGRPQLWLRGLDSAATKLLPGTSYAQFPFWSPDSQSVGFFADGKLQRMDIAGGSPQVLSDAVQGFGGTWNRDGIILFCPNNGSLFRIPATGGNAERVTRVEMPQQTSHRHPVFLPDSIHFLFFATGSEGRGVYIGSLDGTKPQRLLGPDTAAATITSSGQLLFVRQGTLWSQELDLNQLAMRGEPTLIADPVIVDVQFRAAVSASATGSLIYRSGAGNNRQFKWFDRSGHETGTVGAPDSNNLWMWSMSPDGRRLAINRTVGGNFDIWLMDIARGVLTPLTVDPRFDFSAVWSRDGQRIVYRGGDRGLFDRAVDATPGSDKPLFEMIHLEEPTDWSADGRFVVFERFDDKTNWDILAVPFDRDQKAGTPFPVVQTNSLERNAQFSPDGKWIAYQSNESGRPEIYIQPFPGPGPKARVSTNGGIQVRWKRDGSELFYLAADGRLTAVPVRFGSSSGLDLGTPVPLFWTHMYGAGQATTVLHPQYVVSSDGQRFLMNTISETPAGPVTIVLNWKPKPQR